MWLTYLGGSGYDVIFPGALSVAPDGRVALAGQTGSNNFPTTAGAFQPNSSGTGGVNSDAFVAVLSANGSTLLYSSYLGGTGGGFGDWAHALSWDGSGPVYVAGYTTSSNFPVTPSAVDATYNGAGDCFLSLLDPALSGSASLVYSTYLGSTNGAHEEGVQAIDVDSGGVVTLVGSTWGSDFPTTPNAFDSSANGQEDGFVARIDPSISGPSGLLFSTYVGSGARDIPRDVVVDPSGLITVVGQTDGGNFPTTPNAISDSSGGGSDGFLFRIDLTTSPVASMLYSSYFGGSEHDWIYGVALGGSVSELLVCGATQTTTLPTSTTALQVMFAGGLRDSYFASFDFTRGTPAMKHLTYLGGADDDVSHALVVGSGCDLWTVGRTNSVSFPVRVGRYDLSHNGGWDMFLSRVSMSPEEFPSFCDASDGSLAACPCANAGSPDTGCDLQQGTGGVRFDVTLQRKAPVNRATVSGTGFPLSSAPAALVMRGTSVDPASPVVFGDGLLCVSAPLVRLGATFASGGVSSHTFGHGSMAGFGSFYYQIWFRNTPIMFCDPNAGFNLSNGRVLQW
jgi:hypothetical protein